MTSADYAARAEATADLARRALRSREPIANGTRLTFAAAVDIERELREVIAAEARCCAFLRMDLRPGAHAWVLEVTGPAEAEPIIAQLFAGVIVGPQAPA